MKNLMFLFVLFLSFSLQVEASIVLELLPERTKKHVVIYPSFRDSIDAYLKFEPWRVGRMRPKGVILQKDEGVFLFKKEKVKIAESRDLSIFIYSVVLGELDDVVLLEEKENIFPVMVIKKKTKELWLVTITWIPTLKKWGVGAVPSGYIMKKGTQVFLSY